VIAQLFAVLLSVFDASNAANFAMIVLLVTIYSNRLARALILLSLLRSGSRAKVN
jgi:hypothetical protein